LLYKQNLNHRQTAWLSATLLCSGSSFLMFFQNVAKVAGGDARFSQLLPIGYAFFMAAVFAELARAYPGKTLFEIVMLVCGKWVGRAINVILLVYLWIVITIDLNGIAHFLKSSLLPRTPLGIIVMMLILMLMTYRRVEVAASINELCFPFYFFSIILMALLLNNEYLYGKLEPLLTESLFHIFAGNYMSVGMYGDLFILGAFLPAFSHPRISFVSMKHGVLLANFLLTLVGVITLGVMGRHITGVLSYPSWSLVQEVRLTDFLDRLEIYMLTVWFPVFTVKAVLTYLAIQVGLGSLSAVRQYSVYNPALGTLLISLVTLGFQEARELQDFLGYSYTAVTLVIQLPLLLGLFLCAKMRRSDRDNPSIPKQRKAAWICNASLLGCAATILVGKILYKAYFSFGFSLLFLYFALILTALISSYAEMQITNHYFHKMASGVEKS